MKRTTMNPFSRRAWALGLLAAVIGGNVATQSARAQAKAGDAAGLVGSWFVTINVVSPPGFSSFPALMTFHPDGTMLQSRLSYIATFGMLETPGYGGWMPTKWNQIAATTVALVQGAPGNTSLNGAFTGTEKVNFQPVLSGDGNSFTAQWTSTVSDPNGNPTLQGNGNMSAVRIKVEE